MFYSYGYKALNNKCARVADALMEDGEATPQGIELDAEPMDVMPVINAESIREVPVGRYSFGITLNGSDFTLVNFDSFVEGLMAQFGVEAVEDAQSKYAEESLRTMFDNLCDEKFGAYDWGDEEYYSECSSCYTWIDTEDMYNHDYWVTDDGAFLCGDCVRENPGSYLEAMTDNTDDESKLLTSDEFEDNGWRLADSFSQFDGYPRTRGERSEMLRRLLEEHPGGHFIFDASCIGTYPHEYRVWGKWDESDDDSDNDD